MLKSMLKLIVSIYLALTNSMVYDPTKIPYWADPRIHMFGNNNKFHALVAPIFTSYLDKSVYKADLRYHALDYFVNVCYVRDDGARWWLLDDESVRPVGWDAVRRVNPYMLFYARARPHVVFRAAPARPREGE